VEQFLRETLEDTHLVVEHPGSTTEQADPGGVSCTNRSASWTW